MFPSERFSLSPALRFRPRLSGHLYAGCGAAAPWGSASPHLALWFAPSTELGLCSGQRGSELRFLPGDGERFVPFESRAVPSDEFLEVLCSRKPCYRHISCDSLLTRAAFFYRGPRHRGSLKRSSKARRPARSAVGAGRRSSPRCSCAAAPPRSVGERRPPRTAHPSHRRGARPPSRAACQRPPAVREGAGARRAAIGCRGGARRGGEGPALRAAPASALPPGAAATVT